MTADAKRVPQVASDGAEEPPKRPPVAPAGDAWLPWDTSTMTVTVNSTVTLWVPTDGDSGVRP